MEGVAGIFHGIISHAEYLDTYLDALKEHQPFKNQIDVSQIVTSLLMKPAHRLLGIKLLNKCLEECSIDLLEKKIHVWISAILKVFHGHDPDIPESILYTALATLAKTFNLTPELIKTFVSNHLLKIYEVIITSSPPGQLEALRCLEICLSLYPGPSAAAKHNLEQFLEHLIDTNDNNISQICAKCQILLLQIRCSENHGISSKTQWQNYQYKLLGSLHTVFDEMYKHCTELVDSPTTAEALKTNKLDLSNEPIHRTMQLYIRFQNILGYLVTALETPFPVEKPIAVKKLLDLINRGIGINCVTLDGNFVSENLALGILIPKVHFYLLDLMRSIIIILGGHLKIYHHNILKLLLATFKWTSAKHTGDSKMPYSNLRKKAYEVLSLWCSVMRTGSRSEIIAEAIFTEIFKDIMTTKTRMTLKVQSKTRKQLSRNNIQKSDIIKNQQYNPNRQFLSNEGNADLSIEALNCLQSILISSANFLKPNILQKIQKKIIQICSIFYELPLKPHQLYYNYRCRLEIYKVLYILLSTSQEHAPAPIYMGITILQIASLRDSSEGVKNECCRMLLNLEKILHPQKESLLYLPRNQNNLNNNYSIDSTYLLNCSPKALVENTSEKEQPDVFLSTQITNDSIKLLVTTNSGDHNVISNQDKDLLNLSFAESGNQRVSHADIFELNKNCNREELEHANNEIVMESSDTFTVNEVTPLTTVNTFELNTNQEANLSQKLERNISNMDEDVLIADIAADFISDIN